MPLIPLDRIDENGHNIRRTPATAEQDEQLVQSIRALGVLQPVLLRHGEPPDRYFVVAGHRRVRCARLAGHEAIPAEVMRGDAAIFAASQAAENIVRVPMDPVDQWRAMVALQEAGYPLPAAADALGISERKARRLDKLGNVAPEILDLMVGGHLPHEDDLATIAGAGIEEQRSAFASAPETAPADTRIDLIARRLRKTRIPRSAAIFDVEASGILFEEDLFAEPGSDDQFTTRDVDGFLKAQKAALVASINARKKKGERVTLCNWQQYYGAVLPKGFTRSYGDQKKRYPANGKLMLFMCVGESGIEPGTIQWVHATEDAKAEAKGSGTQNPDDDEGWAPLPSSAPRIGAEPAAGDPETAEPALTKRGQTLLAAIKTDALRDALDAETDGSEPAPIQLPALAAALVLALSADNVTVAGEASHFARTQFSDLRAEIVSPGGTFLDLDEAQAARLVAMALSRILRVTDPVTAKGSGVVAEWIGAMAGADRHLPRVDTPEFLACMGKDALSALAVESGRSGLKTAKGVREALAGSLPDWRPVTFGAPGPHPITTSEAINEEQEDAA